MAQLRCRTLLALAVALCARLAWAQEIGTVASMEGQAEIGRGGAWQPTATGAAIHTGDTIRTGTPGKLRIVFQDDSVVTVSDGSHLRIDEQVFDPDRGVARSALELLRGTVRSLVGEYYHTVGNQYEVKTPTAVCGVRGTEFLTSYDPETQTTDVVGISGHVQVHGILDPTGPGVLITAHEATTVRRGSRPGPPRRVEDTMFRQRLEGIRFVGGGRMESMVAGNPVRAGASVSPPERAPASGAGPQSPRQGPFERRDAGTLLHGSPPIIGASTGQLGIAFPK
ncbi:MAG: FecR family protein [Candidatus Binatia bacterium]